MSKLLFPFLAVDSQSLENDGSDNTRVKVDGSTLERAAGGLQVKDGGIDENKIASSAIGNGLTGGSGTALSVDKKLAQFKQVSNFTPSAGDDDVDTALTAVAAADAVTTDFSTVGVYCDGTGDYSLGLPGSTTNVTAKGKPGWVRIVDNSTKDAIDDGSGNEVYGVLYYDTNSSAFRIKYYSDQSGTQTAYTFGGSPPNIDFVFGEVVEFHNVAVSSFLAMPAGFVDVVAGDITSVTAGSGLTGGGVTGSVTLNVGAGNGITVNADSIEVTADSTGGANLATVIDVNANGVAIKIDDSSIGENGSNQLYVKAGGITGTELNASVAGNGLTGGGGGPLAVSVGNGIQIVGDAVSFAPAAVVTGGASEIDGDKLDIDWNPTNYTPTTSPAEADSVDNLTAHLAGIDSALGSVSTAPTLKSAQFTLDGTDISNKYVDLSEAVTGTLAATQLVIKGGAGQFYGDDFQVTTNGSDNRRVSWDSLGLDGVLAAGHKITVYYLVA